MIFAASKPAQTYPDRFKDKVVDFDDLNPMLGNCFSPNRAQFCTDVKLSSIKNLVSN